MLPNKNDDTPLVSKQTSNSEMIKVRKNGFLKISEMQK